MNATRLLRRTCVPLQSNTFAQKRVSQPTTLSDKRIIKSLEEISQNQSAIVKQMQLDTIEDMRKFSVVQQRADVYNTTIEKLNKDLNDRLSSVQLFCSLGSGAIIGAIGGSLWIMISSS